MSLGEQMQQFDETFQLPEGFEKETAEQEILYDWDGGVLDETKQDA